MRVLTAVFGILLLFVCIGHAGVVETPRRLNKVVVVMFENTMYSTALKSPAFKALADKGATLTSYQAITNPSQPNYIALMAGDTLGVKGDSRADLNATNLADLLEAKGFHWKAYVEAFPGNCFLGMTKGTYARKHNPLISFLDIQTNPKRCAQIVSADEFAQDVNSGRLPEFSHYVPDMNNTGHDTGISGADQFLAHTLVPLMESEQGQKVTWLVTFDEGNFFSNHILTIVYGDQVQAGAKNGLSYSHYSLLRTIEYGFDLETLGRQDDGVAPILGIWK